MMWSALLTNDAVENVREVTADGKRWLVAPASIMPHGVMSGSKGPLYYPVEEAQKTAHLWDGMPITVQHPFDPMTGQPLAANDEGVEERQHVGVVKNPTHDGKTRAELWFDADATLRKSPETYAALKRDEKIPVSTGLYTDIIPGNGSHNGVAYTATARNHRPDHLAVLPGGRGACHLDDGCGVNVVNREGSTLVTADVVENTGWTDEARAASAAARAACAGATKSESFKASERATRQSQYIKDTLPAEASDHKFAAKLHQDAAVAHFLQGGMSAGAKSEFHMKAGEAHMKAHDAHMKEAGVQNTEGCQCGKASCDKCRVANSSCTCGGVKNAEGICNMCGAKSTGEHATNAWSDEARQASIEARRASAHAVTSSKGRVKGGENEAAESASKHAIETGTKEAHEAAAQAHDAVRQKHLIREAMGPMSDVKKERAAQLNHEVASIKHRAAANLVENAGSFEPPNSFGTQKTPEQLKAEGAKHRKAAEACRAADDDEGAKKHTALADAADEYAGGALLNSASKLSAVALSTGLAKDYQAAADANRMVAADAAKKGDGKKYQLHSQAAAEMESAATTPQTANMWTKLWALVANAPVNSPKDGRFISAKQVADHHASKSYDDAHSGGDSDLGDPNKDKEPDVILDALGVPIKNPKAGVKNVWSDEAREAAAAARAGSAKAKASGSKTDHEAAAGLHMKAAVKAGDERDSKAEGEHMDAAAAHYKAAAGGRSGLHNEWSDAAREASKAARAASAKANSSGLSAHHLDAAKAHWGAEAMLGNSGKAAGEHAEAAAAHFKEAAKRSDSTTKPVAAGAKAGVQNREWSQAERDKLKPDDFAGPNQSFPIVTQADLDNACQSLGRAKDMDEVKAGIRRIAKKKNLKLPDTETWNMATTREQNLALLTANCKCETDRVALNNLSDEALEALTGNKEFTSDAERKAAFAHMNDPSETAKAASAKAEKSPTAGNHRKAAAAHRDAAEHHSEEGNKGMAEAHMSMARGHSISAGKLSTKNAAVENAPEGKKRKHSNADKNDDDLDEEEDGEMDDDDDETTNALNPQNLMATINKMDRIAALTANISDPTVRKQMVAQMSRWSDRRLQQAELLQGRPAVNAAFPALLPIFGAQPTPVEKSGQVDNSVEQQEIVTVDYTANASPELLRRINLKSA